MNLDIRLKLILASIIGIIVIMAVGVPITADLAEDAKYTTHKLDEGYLYTLAEDGKPVTIEIYANSTIATINGKDYSINQYGQYIISDNILAGYMPQETAYHNIIFNGTGMRLETNADSTETMKFVFADGVCTLTRTLSNGSITELTTTYDYLLHYSGGSGNYVTSDIANRIIVNEDSKVYFFANRGTWGTSYIADPANAGSEETSARSYTNGTESTTTLTWTLRDNGDGSFNVTNLTLGVEDTITNYAIPSKYTTYGDNAISSIVSMIPIILTIMLLVMASGVLVYNLNTKSDL